MSKDETSLAEDLTYFAPAERATQETIDRQSLRIAGEEGCWRLFDAVNEPVLVLNAQRQVVFGNSSALEMIGLADAKAIYGRRPGEILDCERACTMSAGCGTSEFCSTCGAVGSIMAGLGGTANARECRIMRGASAEALDLLVRSTPLVIDDEQFVIIALKNISHEKRRRVLERIFFHDLMNSAWAVDTLADVLSTAKPERAELLRQRLHEGTQRLVEEIASHRDLLAAERDDLALRPERIDPREVVDELVKRHADQSNVNVSLDVQQNVPTAIVTDPTLLRRVLNNMIINALEASASDSTVRINCHCDGDKLCFTVHNDGCIPRDVQLQMFQRSFSTKGSGRGLGTYSMKLLTTRYLRGSIDFSSDETSGTTFRVTIPMKLSTRTC